MAKKRETAKTPPKKSVWAKERYRAMIRFLIEIGIAVVLALLCAVFFEGSITVQESSMDPTIQAGDTVLINRLSYRFGSVHRGDLIAYRNEDARDTVYHIKRVIGLPGETVQIKDGLIMINGETYLESRELPNIIDPGIALNPVTLGTGEYFVLGDFASYVDAWEKMDKIYSDKERWQAMSLANIANSAFFSSDRTIREYAEDIWKAL